MRNRLTLSVLALLAFCLNIGSAGVTSVIDDSDLTGPSSAKASRLKLFQESRLIGRSRVFSLKASAPLAQIRPMGESSISGILLLTDPDGIARAGGPARVFLYGRAGGRDGILSSGETDAQGKWSLPVPDDASGPAFVRFRLENSRWAIQQSAGEPYEWQAATVLLPLKGSWDAGTFRLDPATENGKLGFIHLQLFSAFDFFDKQKVNTDWWTRRLQVNFPVDGAYFSPWDFSLNLSQPESWSVNLHEFGHAVMAAGTRSHGGGGQHKIDECYNKGLAWSEGWATFFAAAVHLSPDDPDAKFDTYLVPRRAPIRIENVPDDVCKGATNEWRVAAGLWDLYDTHPDGLDHFSMSFAQLWSAIQGQSMGSFQDAWGYIEKTISQDQQAAAADALRQNTLPPGFLAVRAIPNHAGSGLDSHFLAAPPANWDGIRNR